MAVTRSAALFLAALSLQPVSAVDRSKFRTCQQGSFCRRFTQWITQPAREEALWSVLPETKVSTAEGGLAFQVKHRNEAAPHLLLLLDTYAEGIVRMRVNEMNALFPRHVIPVGDVVVDPPPAAAENTKVTDGAGSTIISFQTSGHQVSAELKHSPVGLEVSVDGVLLQKVNARNYFNFERYRQPKNRLPPDTASAGVSDPNQVTLDAAAHPTVDTNGLWEEEFGGHTDKKPRGPASLGMDVTFEGNVPGLFGLPEHMTKASLPFYDQPYRFYNLDVFEYENNEPMALYGAVPFIWAIHQREKGESLASGFIWLNPSETFVKLERNAPEDLTGPAHAWWTSESGVMDAVIVVGPTPAKVSAQYHRLTGHGPLPPLWALGKHQCRWNYMNEKDVATVDSQYDKYDIPYDVIWLDIEHTDGKQYFTWHPTNFPTPGKMIDAISAKKRKFVNVVDPHIKKEEKFHVYTEIRDQGMFVKKIDWKQIDDPADSRPMDWDDVEEILDPDAKQPEVWNEEEDGKWDHPKIANPAYKGQWTSRKIQDPNSPASDFEGWCWPGTSGYPDFTDPKVRKYWGSQFALDKYKGTNADTYIWNDMNEPSVFNGPEVTMPRDAIHPQGNTEHRDVHNMYGYYVHRATFEGLEARSPVDRPFVLTRSFFAGSHRYAAIWTGDNTAEWPHLGTSIAMVGALTLTGISLSGADVGGFFKHPDGEMVARWYQMGVLAYPFLRNHAHLETPRREPYTYDDETMELVKASLQLRYKMLPLWYTIFEEYHRLGKPVVRPLFWDFIHDPVTHADQTAVEDQIMLGDAVLVHGISKPMSQQGAQTQVYLPAVAGWYDMHTGSFYKPGRHTMPVTMQNIPVFYRAGTIVPLKNRIRRSSTCMHQDPHTLNVYLDPATHTARGRLYIDDYKTKQYQDGTSFLSADFKYDNGVLWQIVRTGSLPAGVSAEVERVEIFGLSKAPAKAEVNIKGNRHTLPLPVVRELPAGPSGEKLFATVVKIQPWIDLREEWALKLE